MPTALRITPGTTGATPHTLLLGMTYAGALEVATREHYHVCLPNIHTDAERETIRVRLRAAGLRGNTGFSMKAGDVGALGYALKGVVNDDDIIRSGISLETCREAQIAWTDKGAERAGKKLSFNERMLAYVVENRGESATSEYHVRHHVWTFMRQERAAMQTFRNRVLYVLTHWPDERQRSLWQAAILENIPSWTDV